MASDSAPQRPAARIEPKMAADDAFDYPLLASELLRALRGKRSQAAFARRLGYGSNVAHNWEHARSAPTAARTLVVAGKVRIDLRTAFERFYRLTPAWVANVDLATPPGVAAFLRDLKGQQSVVSVAEAMGKTRFSITRWLQAKTEPKLPEFLQYIEVTSQRLLDFLAVLVDPENLPSVRSTWLAMQRARSLAYEQPWTQAVLRALELREYQTRTHDNAWLARKLGIGVSELRRCLTQLERSREIRWDGAHWQLIAVRALDIGRDRARARALRAWWGRIGVQRAARGSEGMVYNLLGVSRIDLDRLRLLQKNYINELRSIVARSEPVECVVLAADLLIDLSAEQTPPVEITLERFGGVRRGS